MTEGQILPSESIEIYNTWKENLEVHHKYVQWPKEESVVT